MVIFCEILLHLALSNILDKDGKVLISEYVGADASAATA